MSKAKRKAKIESDEEIEPNHDSEDDFEIHRPKRKVATRKRKREEESDEEPDLDSDLEDSPKRKKKRAKTKDNDFEEEDQQMAPVEAEEEPDHDIEYEWHQCGEPYVIHCSFSGDSSVQIPQEKVKYVVSSLYCKNAKYYLLFNEEKKMIAKAAGPKIPFPFGVMPFNEKYNIAQNKGASRSTIDAAKLWKISIKYDKLTFPWPNLGQLEWKATIFINKAQLEKLLREDKPVPYYSLVVKALTQRIKEGSNTEIISNHLHDKANTPFKIDIPEKQPPGFRTKLFKYQLDAVSWMKLIEEKSKTALSVNYTMKIPATNFTVDLTNGRILVKKEGEENDNLSESPKAIEFAFSGGVLADEMGLGKTAEVLGLILANPRPLPLPVRDTHVYTKATLVISPNHLAKQWIQEAQKHVSKKFKVLLITTMPQYEKITYGDIQSADMVVVSFQFLKNPSFTKMTVTETDMCGNTLALNQRYVKESMLSYLYTRDIIIDGQNWQRKTGFLFDHFHWHRIIIDEGHETTDKKWNSAMFVYPSNYSWYVTGTPFPSSAAKQMAFSITKFHQETYVKPLVFKKAAHKIIDELGQKLFVDNLFWRNTKESVKGEMKVPPIVEELILMEFSEVERAMYRDAQGDLERQRQVCCHLQISKKDEAVLGEAPKSLDEVRKLMIANKESIIRSLQKNIWETEDSLKCVTDELARGPDKKRKLELDISIENYKVRLGQLKSDLNRQSAVLRFFQAIVPTERHEQECTICFDQMQFASIIPCGHMFCDACIKQALKARQACPMCREKVNADQVTLLKKVEQKEEPKEEKEVAKDLKKLIEEHGTKMANLITYLRNLWANKETKSSQVIVFSQWDSMLRRIGETLEENGIENVFVRGNVHVRNAAITKFKNSKKVKVIMLSLENAASGINLTEATHVILIDPVAGTKAQAQAIEGQAIGRAHRQGQDHQVTVVRLIVKDTIEHEIYKRNTEVEENDNSSEEETTTISNLRASNSNLRKSIDNLSSPVPVITNNRNNNNEETVNSPTRLAKSGSHSRLNTSHSVIDNKERKEEKKIEKDDESEEEKPQMKKTGSKASLKRSTQMNVNNVNLKKSSSTIPKNKKMPLSSSSESDDSDSESDSEPKRKNLKRLASSSSSESDSD